MKKIFFIPQGLILVLALSGCTKPTLRASAKSDASSGNVEVQLEAQSKTPVHAETLTGQSLGFVVGFEDNDDTYLKQGFFSFGPDGALTENYFLYDGNADLSFGATPYTFYVPGYNYNDRPTCAATRFKISNYSASLSATGTWAINVLGSGSSQLVVTIGAAIYTWSVPSTTDGRFVLQSLNGIATISPASKTLGFGYLTADPTKAPPISPTTDVSSKGYSGKLFETDTATSTTWTEYNDGFTPSAFSWLSPANNAAGNPLELGGSFTPHCDTNDSLTCTFDVLFNYAPYSNSLFYTNGGHQFDGSNPNCYTQSGHMTTYLAIRSSSGAVTHAVGAQYSWQYNRQTMTNVYPILGLSYWDSN